MSQEGHKKMTMPIPLTRVKTILKSSPAVASMEMGTTHMASKAAELFLAKVTNECFKASKGKDITYEHLQKVIYSNNRYFYLRDMVPDKVDFKDYVKLREQIEAKESEVKRFVYAHELMGTAEDEDGSSD